MKDIFTAWPVIRKYKDGMYYLIIFGALFCVALPWAALFAKAFLADPAGYARNPVYGESMAIFALGIALISGPSAILFRTRNKNEAGQQFSCTHPVALTILCMEKKLLHAGATADRAMATPSQKEAFRVLAAEVQRDFVTLSPAVRMAGTDPFRFQSIEALKAKGLA